MKKLAGIVFVLLAAIFAANAVAQPVEAMERRRFSQMELDQMLAPIALYPDALLSQILMAATYPRDVYEAAGWARSHRVSGQEAVRAVEREPWDASVISLAAFPHVLEMMDERREWTERLGEAFLGQPEQVMDTVQELRRRAYDAGHLRSTNELYVERSGPDYVIQSPPEEVYVPYYDPRVVYGGWWWPGYDPVYWGPWDGYAYAPGWGFGWGPSIYVGSAFFFGSFDWRYRDLRYSHHRPWYWRGHDYRHGHRWSHNREHGHRSGGRHWRDGDGSRQVRDGRSRDRDGSGRSDWRDRRDGTRAGRGGGTQDNSTGPLGGAAQVREGYVAPVPQAAARSDRAQAQERFQQRERIYRDAPQQQLGGARSVQVPSASVGPAPQRVHTAPPQQHAAPAYQPRAAAAPQVRVAPAPVERAAPQPVERAAPQPMARPAPVERAAPERPAPATAPERPMGGAARVRDR